MSGSAFDPLGYQLGMVMQLCQSDVDKLKNDLFSFALGIADEIQEMCNRQLHHWISFYANNQGVGLSAHDTKELFEEVQAYIDTAPDKFSFCAEVENKPSRGSFTCSSKHTDFAVMSSAFLNVKRIGDEKWNRGSLFSIEQQKGIKAFKKQNGLQGLQEYIDSLDLNRDHSKDEEVYRLELETAEAKALDAAWKCLNCSSDTLQEIRYMSIQDRGLLTFKYSQERLENSGDYKIECSIVLPHILFASKKDYLQSCFTGLIKEYCSKAKDARALTGLDAINGRRCIATEEYGFQLIYPQIAKARLGDSMLPGIQWGTYIQPEIVQRLGGVSAIREWNAWETVGELANGGVFAQVSNDIDVYPYDKCKLLYDKLADFLWHGTMEITEFGFPSFRLPVARDRMRFRGIDILVDI